MEKIIINHSCEIYNRRTLSPTIDKKLTYNESLRDKISLKRIFNKNYKQIFPNEKIKKSVTRINDTYLTNEANNFTRRRFENDFSKFLKIVI